MDEFVNYRWVLTILIFWVGLYLINNFIGIQYLIASNNDKVYRNYYAMNGIIVLLGFILLIPPLKSLGAAISMCLGEICFSILWLLNSRKLFVSR
jgi:PST family polysaccharide transporter